MPTATPESPVLTLCGFQPPYGMHAWNSSLGTG